MKKNLQHALLSRKMDQCDANKQQMATGYTRAFVLYAHVCCQILEILYTFIFMFLEDLLCLYFNFPVVFECWANVFECFTLFSTWFKTKKKTSQTGFTKMYSILLPGICLYCFLQ